MQNVEKPSGFLGRKLILTLQKCPNSLSQPAALARSPPKGQSVFQNVSLSLHLLRTFLYKEIKDDQNLEGVWTDISTPMTILLRMKLREICQENPCQEELLLFYLTSLLQQH